jgi:hypothetical protein
MNISIIFIKLEKHCFDLNAYLYQARNLLMLDFAGESDPFARISLKNISVYSRTIDDNINPTWNETLSIPNIYLYGNLEELYQHPPEVVIDIFDEDPFNVTDRNY